MPQFVPFDNIFAHQEEDHSDHQNWQGSENQLTGVAAVSSRAGSRSAGDPKHHRAQTKEEKDEMKHTPPIDHPLLKGLPTERKREGYNDKTCLLAS